MFSIGTIDVSFLCFFKIIVLIFFILLNIGLIYTEYLQTKHKNRDYAQSHLKSGITPELKKIASNLIVGLGIFASGIAIKNEYFSQQEQANRDKREAALKAALSEAKREISEIKNQTLATDFSNKLRIDRMQRNLDQESILKTKKSALMQAIEDRKAVFTDDPNNPDLASFIRSRNSEIRVIDLERNRGSSELQQLIKEGVKFHADISKETAEDTVVANVTEDAVDIKISSIFLFFDFDLEEL